MKMGSCWICFTENDHFSLSNSVWSLFFSFLFLDPVFSSVTVSFLVFQFFNSVVPRPMEDPIKSLFSVFPSVFPSFSLSVRQFCIFLRNGSFIFFLTFGTMVDNWNI